MGTGNAGGQLAANLQRHGVYLTVRDLEPARSAPFVSRGAHAAASARELAERVDVLTTVLPSPAACQQVMEAADGVLAGLTAGKLWLEMSPPDYAEVRRLAARV